jgi:hypothetical protein
MRQGYRQLNDALTWLGKHKKVNVSREIGGALGPGIHTATVIEYVNGGGYTDFVLESPDKHYHKERVWNKRTWNPPLGTKWKFELDYAGDGKHYIVRGGDKYSLIEDTYKKCVLESERIRDLYAYIRDNNLKLRYLRMKWRRAVEDK